MSIASRFVERSEEGAFKLAGRLASDPKGEILERVDLAFAKESTHGDFTAIDGLVKLNRQAKLSIDRPSAIAPIPIVMPIDDARRPAGGPASGLIVDELGNQAT